MEVFAHALEEAVVELIALRRILPDQHPLVLQEGELIEFLLLLFYFFFFFFALFTVFSILAIFALLGLFCFRFLGLLFLGRVFARPDEGTRRFGLLGLNGHKSSKHVVLSRDFRLNIGLNESLKVFVPSVVENPVLIANVGVGLVLRRSRDDVLTHV